jgi:hypothetical protein
VNYFENSASRRGVLAKRDAVNFGGIKNAPSSNSTMECSCKAMMYLTMLLQCTACIMKKVLQRVDLSGGWHPMFDAFIKLLFFRQVLFRSR